MEDPYLWLEDVTGDRALAWVRSHNAVTERTFATTPAFESLRSDLRSIYDSKARIPYVSKVGPYYYNLWKDAEHPRGLWRRTTPNEYRRSDPR